MATRTSSRTLVILTLSPLRLVVAQETNDSPSSSAFPAAAPVEKPTLAKTLPATEPFPWARKAGS